MKNTAADPPGPSTHTPVAPSGKEEIRVSPVYIDDTELISNATGTYLHVSGHLPTPCHQLAPPVKHTENDTLHLTITSWQKKDVMCAQVLEPFVYYLKIADVGEPMPPAVRLNDMPVGP